MADIRLAKPAAGTTQTVPSAPDGRFIFDFPADAATLTRNGDDLVLTFEDGAAIQLQGFYTTYSKEEMPSFQVDGVEISGQDFFAALDEDLMPAAGPASGSSAARGGRYNEYGGSDLLDGLDHLGRLDIGFDGGTQLATDTVEPSPYSEVDHGVTVTPSTPGTDPDDPSIPVQGEDFPPTMPHDVLQVDESALDGGSGGGSATAAGSMRVSAPDGVAIITIGGVVVWQNGALTGNPVLTDEGHLDVTGFDGTNLTYTYTLTGSTQEHAKLNAGGENDAIAHEMEVVVTDTDGDSGSAVIRVEITDDVPTIESFEKTVTEGDADPIVGNALEGAVAGADSANFAWTNPDQQGRYGKLTLNEDGTYSYELNNDDPEVKALTGGDTRTEEISYTYTDADGDVAEGKVTITINGVDNGVVVGSGTLTVYEAGLGDGSTPGGGNTPTTASGSLHINAPDGVATIAIGEVTVFENGALTSSNTISTDEGVLTVTGFDAVTGELTFTYTLNDNTLEHGLDGMDTHVSHDFAVTVTDVDGSTASSTITVNIVDDEPTAKNDRVLFEEAAAQKGASGESVLENDVFGADAPADKMVTSVNGGNPGETVSGTYGELTLHADGTYTYKLGDEVDVPNGKIYTENFTYTITDADGDTSTATLTIAIEGDKIVPANPGNATIVVDEGARPDGSGQHKEHGFCDTGSFTVNLKGEDGAVTLKYGTGEDASTITLSLINGNTFDENWLSINKTLTVNGVEVEVTGATQTEPGGPWKIEYTYELTGQQTHDNVGSVGAVGAEDALSDSINITVTDATGDTSTGSLTVTVHDDGPVLTAKIDPQPDNDKGYYYDTDAAIVFRLAEDGPTTKLSDIDFGADVGTGEEGSAPARITVTVNDTEFTVTVTRDAGGQLHFSGENSGTITFDKTGAATGADDGSKLTYDTVTGQFTYTRPTADVGGTANEYTFTLTVTDADGDTVQQTGSVVTVFREPTITGDDGSTSSTVTTDEGNLEQGSDWETDATRPHEDTASGELTVNLDHADGTIQIGSLTIGVDKDGKVVSVNGNPAASLDGKTVPGDHGYLSNITVSEAGTDGSITIKYDYTLTNAVDGDGASDNRPAEGEDGRGESMQADSFAVTVTANGQTATGSIMANALDDAPRLDVTPEATSTQNDTADSSLSGTFRVNFGADGPSENEALTIAGQAIDKEGTTTLRVDGGTLTISYQSDGTYAYTYKHNQQDVTFGKKTFAVVATDGDMDTTQAIITVGQDFHPTTENDQFGAGQIHEVVTTDESYMEAGGSQAGQTSDDGIGQSAMESVTVNLHGENAETSITITHGEQTITFTYDGMKWSAGGQDSEAVIQGDYGQLSVWVSKALDNDNNVTIGYEYKQTAPYTTHGDPNDANETAEAADSFGITINDRDGTPLTGSISVNIRDDAPVLNAKIDTQPGNDEGYYYDKDATIVFQLAEGGLPTTLDQINFGADVGTGEGESSPALITVKVNDTKFTVEVTRGAEGTLHFSGENNGTITFKNNADDGSALTYDTAKDLFTYTRPTADVGGAADTYGFTLTVTDADGDTAQTETFTVTTKTVAPTISLTDANIIVDEGALADGSRQHTRDGFTGTKEFTVNLHGEDGTIILSADGGNKITLEVKDGALEISQDASITVNGVTISNLMAKQADDGTSWTVSYDYELTKQQTHTTSNSSNYHEDGKSADLTISVTSQSGQTVTETLPVTVHDDGPQFTADSTNFTSVDTDTDQYWSHEGEISFTENSFFLQGKSSDTVNLTDGNQFKISVGTVYFTEENRDEVTNTNIDAIKTGEGKFYHDFSNGIGITSWDNHDDVDGTLYFEHDITNTQRLQEICYDYANNRSEAVIIELGKTALNMDISLKSFFGGTSEGTEKAIFLFYKDGQLIDTTTLSSNSSSGNVTGDHLLVDQPDGFDTVVIAAMHNGVSTDVTQDNSDFAIGALTFNKFDGAIKTLNGRLDATSADGIRSYQIDIEGLSQCGLTYGEQAITYSRDGDKVLAKAGDTLIFDITLNEQSGAWVMAQYKNYEGELKLPFTATDGDGDSTSISVMIPATGAESGTYKVTDSDAEKAVLAAAEQEMKSAVRSGEALATAAALAGMATVLPDEVPAAEGDRPDTPDETLVAAPAEAADAPAALSFVEEGAALPDSPVDGMDDTPLLFANLALAGQEEPMVSAVQTDAADGPLWADASGTDDTSGTVVGETATAGPGAAHPGTAAPEAVLHGTDGDDILLGGDGDELIFGGSGDDFIDGGEGRDTIYAGDGNDIIVYDKADYLVSGGSGIDFMVSDDSELTLDTLLSGGKDGHEGPIVDSIEVLITGKDALSLTSIQELADKYGIELGTNPAGQETLTLDMGKWTEQADGSYDFHGGAEEGGLTLETNLQHDSAASSDNGEMAQQVFILEHTNS